jgi:Ca-activated chloride channel family protein
MSRPRKARRGATLAMIAIMLPVILVLAAFAINVAYMELNRTELRVATDAATRAAGRTYAMTGNVAQSRKAGQDTALRNTVANKPLSLATEDFVFGKATRASTATRYAFAPATTNINSVQVTGRRTAGSPDGPVKLLFPNMIGRSTYEPKQVATSSQVEVDLALVIDRSGSMAYASNEPTNISKTPAGAPKGWDFCDAAPPKSRWLDAIAAVDIFLTELNKTPIVERVSLASYSTDALLNKNLVTDYTQISSALNAYTLQFCGGSTNIGGGIDQARLSLVNATPLRPWASRIIVVMTDGIHNTGTDPIAAATRAAAADIQVFAVTFSIEADQTRMKKVAEIGHGRHYYASNGTDLKKVFQDIASSLPTLLTQ